MSEINFKFSIASDVDYENLIADIGFDNNLVALLTQEQGFDNLRIQIYPPDKGSCWNFPLKEFEEIIEKAKERLQKLSEYSENENGNNLG